MQAITSALTTSALLLLSACSSSSSTATKPPPVTTGTKDSGSVADSGGGGTATFTAPTPDACITSVASGLQKLTCEGLSFEVAVPDVCVTSKACGLITDVHGFGMNDDVEELHTLLQESAGAKGYIVLQPSAPGSLLSASWSPSNDAQVFAIMQHVIDVFHVDPNRIHFDGYSEGAWMTWRFVCAHSDLLASAAPISGGNQPGQSCTFTGTDVPARKLPILETHGRNDGLLAFAQATQQRDAVVAAWYPGGTSETVQKDFDYQWDRWTDSDGNVFEFVQHDWECGFKLGTIALKGHCFPGSTQFLGCGRKSDAGAVSYPFEWTNTILQFFIDHPKK